MKHCLVLNADYSPIDIVGWQRAFLMIFGDNKNAYPIEYHGYTILDSAGRKHSVPSIIVLKKYVNNNNHVSYCKYTRANVFTRDDFKCMYCGHKFKADDLTIDHVIPLSRYTKLGHKGNPNALDNVVTACYNCNVKKGNHTCTEINMYPIKTPRKVTKRECLINKIRNMKIPVEWEDYIQHVN